MYQCIKFKVIMPNPPEEEKYNNNEIYFFSGVDVSRFLSVWVISSCQRSQRIYELGRLNGE